MALKLVWIIFCTFSLGLIHDFTEGHKSSTWTPISDLPRVSNITLFVSYANNVFGTSIKLKYSNEPNTSNTLYLNGFSVIVPDLNRVKFEQLRLSNNSNIIDRKENEHKSVSNVQSLKEQRRKRGVILLYNMISCSTGCNPLTYLGYGCYCGLWGSGDPVDGVDRCCQLHDDCYAQAGCSIFQYVTPYIWYCFSNIPICAIEHAQYGGPGSCASRLCECDSRFSKCLSRYPCPSSKVYCRSSYARLLHNYALSIFR